MIFAADEARPLGLAYADSYHIYAAHWSMTRTINMVSFVTMVRFCHDYELGGVTCTGTDAI